MNTTCITCDQPASNRWNPLCTPCGEAHLDEVVAELGMDIAR